MQAQPKHNVCNYGSPLFRSALLAFLLLCITLLRPVSAQSSPDDITSRFPSPPKKGSNPKKDAQRHIDYIVTFDSRAGLYGSRCVAEFTQTLGFEYLIPHEGESRKTLKVRWQNTKTKCKVTFKHGPFWMRKVKKRIRQCKITSGDFIG